MTAKPNVRNTREVEKHSINTNTSADDKKTKDCPQITSCYKSETRNNNFII